MSVCGNNEDDSASEEAGAPLKAIYEQKAVSKVVRVLTVLAYLLSVSLAAILLSVYYICVWKAPELPINDPEVLNRLVADNTTTQIMQPRHNIERSNSSVNETVSSSEFTIDVFSSARPPDPIDFFDPSTETTFEDASNLTTPSSSIYNETTAS